MHAPRSWNPLSQELYSGGNDCNLVVWAPAPEPEGGEGSEGVAADADAWSESE